MNENFNKKTKVEQLTKVVLSHGEENGLIVKGPFRSVFLKIDQRPQTNFDLQKFIISCYQTEDIRNVTKLPTFFFLVIRFERCSK